MKPAMFSITIDKSALVLENFLFDKNRKLVRTRLNERKVKYHERFNRFYISLKYFQAARDALREFDPDQSEVYVSFMKRFPAGTPVVIDWYPSQCTVEGGVPISQFVDRMSYFNDEYRQTKMYKDGKIDGIEHLYHAERGTFPSGLLERAIKIMRKQGVPFRIHQHFRFPSPHLHLTPHFSFTPTQDQIDAVEALDASHCGLGKLPTGFGKTSYVASALIAKKGVRTMFLANQRVLIDDAEKDFLEVFAGQDVKIGKIGDGTYDPGDITVASIQGVIAGLKPVTTSEWKQLKVNQKKAQDKLNAEKATGEVKNATHAQLGKAVKAIERAVLREERRADLKTFLESVEMIIVDEAQGLGTAMWKLFLDVCPAPYRYGLTATDTRTNGGRLELIAATGERRFISSADDQIQKGRLSEFRAEFAEFDHGYSEEEIKRIKMDFHQAYEFFIVQNEERNAILIDKLLEWAYDGKSILGLVSHRSHAQVILEELERRGVDPALYRYVDGKTTKTRRQEDIRAFRDSEYPILLGTSIFDVGFNAKNASRMVRFNAGSSEVREPQRAGRTVRMREDGSHGEVFDIYDVGCPFFESQAKKRVAVLRDEFGTSRVHIKRLVRPAKETILEDAFPLDLADLKNPPF